MVQKRDTRIEETKTEPRRTELSAASVPPEDDIFADCREWDPEKETAAENIGRKLQAMQNRMNKMR